MARDCSALCVGVGGAQEETHFDWSWVAIIQPCGDVPPLGGHQCSGK